MRELPPITLYTDNNSLSDTVSTSNVVAEKRLMIDLSALREMVDNKELMIRWISKEKQLADVFTKAGVNKRILTDVLSGGVLRLD